MNLTTECRKGLESEATLKRAKEQLDALHKEEKKAQEKLTKEEKALEEVLASLKGVTADLHVQLEAKQKECVSLTCLFFSPVSARILTAHVYHIP